MKGEIGKRSARALCGEEGERGINSTKIMFQKVIWNYTNGYLKLYIYI